MIKVLKEKFRELQADEDFKKSLRQDIQAVLSTAVVIFALVVFASLSGRGCAVQDLDSNPKEPGENPTQKAEVLSHSENLVPPLPSSGSKGDGK